MKVIDHIEAFRKQKYAVVTIGTFDGVHIGHQAIISKLVEEARLNKGVSILITFWPHPRFILNRGGSKLQLLSTFDEKLALLESLGLDYVIKIPFTPEFSNLSAAQFVADILVERIGTKELFIGYDHRFGNNREGDIRFLKDKSQEYSYVVKEIPKQEIDHIGVSSTKIREALHKANIELANSLLNRKYAISGTVVNGEKLGRTIGFPTANIAVKEDYKLLPADGVYAINALIGQERHKGMLNVGFKPTVSGIARSIEAHVFNFDRNIYGQEITIEFVSLLRNEMKFDSLEKLKKQLELDRIKATEILL